MADTKSAGVNCPVCKLPVGTSHHFCHLCRAAGRDVRFDSETCGADHLMKTHTQEEIDRFDAAQTTSKP